MAAIAEFFMGPALNYSDAQMGVWCLLPVNPYADFSTWSTRPRASDGREKRVEDLLPLLSAHVLRLDLWRNAGQLLPILLSGVLACRK